ncbi:MAG TPA: hypothetical protein VH814_10830 [Steroidobacteraceae bacterium]|jgi:hypothetical protein
MVVLYMLFSFGIVISVSALFWKLAARILRYGGVTWPLAFLTAATIVFILGFVRGVVTVAGLSAPMPIGVVLSLPLPIALGAWCFHDRATRPDGTSVDWVGAFKLSAVAVGLNAVFAVMLIVVTMSIGS